MKISLIWTKRSKNEVSFQYLVNIVTQKPRLDLSTALQSVTLFKNSLAWFLLLKNLWKTKCNVWVNEWMNRQELQEKTVPLAKDVECCIFLMWFFFPLLLFGKPRQPDSSFWYLKKLWGIKHCVPARVWLKDFVRQMQYFKNTLLLLLYNFQGDIKVFIVCETDHSL